MQKDDSGRQISLFDEVDYEKLTIMDRTIDALRLKVPAIPYLPFLRLLHQKEPWCCCRILCLAGAGPAGIYRKCRRIGQQGACKDGFRLQEARSGAYPLPEGNLTENVAPSCDPMAQGDIPAHCRRDFPQVKGASLVGQTVNSLP